MHKLKSKLILPAIMTVCLLLLMQSVSYAGSIPEEARRHMARGQAAVEMAKSPAELEDAIKEFQETARLAPDWPDPHYNLGLAQEKSGKFREAVASFKRYLQLAPNAPDAAKIQEQIYKLEYKAEQVLSIPEIIDVLVSLSAKQTWQGVGDCTQDNIKINHDQEDFRSVVFKREGNDEVKVLKAYQLISPPPRTYQTLKVTGPVLKYITTRNVSATAAINERYGDLTGVMEHEVAVVSKRLVKVNQKVLRGGGGNGVHDGQRFTCTFQKK